MTMTPLERLFLEELPTGRFGNPEPIAPTTTKKRITPRGTCPTCHNTYALTLNDTLRLHGPHGQHCAGSHQPPEPPASGSGPARAYTPSQGPGVSPTDDHPTEGPYGPPAAARAA